VYHIQLVMFREVTDLGLYVSQSLNPVRQCHYCVADWPEKWWPWVDRRWRIDSWAERRPRCHAVICPTCTTPPCTSHSDWRRHYTVHSQHDELQRLYSTDTQHWRTHRHLVAPNLRRAALSREWLGMRFNLPPEDMTRSQKFWTSISKLKLQLVYLLMHIWKVN